MQVLTLYPRISGSYSTKSPYSQKVWHVYPTTPTHIGRKLSLQHCGTGIRRHFTDALLLPKLKAIISRVSQRENDIMDILEGGRLAGRQAGRGNRSCKLPKWRNGLDYFRVLVTAGVTVPRGIIHGFWQHAVKANLLPKYWMRRFASKYTCGSCLESLGSHWWLLLARVLI